MTYGPVLAAAFVLWPVIAVLGGQGFAPLAGLTAIAALFVARPRMPPAVFALIGFGFIAWAVLGEILASRTGSLFSGSLAAGTFSVEASSLAQASLGLTSALTIAAALRSAPSPRSSNLILAMLCLHAAALISVPFTSGFFLSAVYGQDPDGQLEGLQNIGRHANTLALVLPLLVAMLAVRWKLTGVLVAAVLALASVAAFVMLDAQSALFAFVSMAAAMGLVALMPRMGFRWLFGGLAGYIAAAPVLFAALIRGLDPVAQSLPASFRSRLWSWETVIGRMTDAPFTGHGMGATRSWKETYAARPDWLAQLPDFWKHYPIVPGHPHNMALQIWAETGMIGAVLAALSLVALGFHLPRPGDVRPEIRFATAGLAGAAAAIFSFAYSFWNEGFWASVALAAAAVIVWHRTGRGAIPA